MATSNQSDGFNSTHNGDLQRLKKQLGREPSPEESRLLSFMSPGMPLATALAAKVRELGHLAGQRRSVSTVLGGNFDRSDRLEVLIGKEGVVAVADKTLRKSAGYNHKGELVLGDDR